MLLVDIIALQRSFPTFPVKVILIQPSDMAPAAEVEIVVEGDEEEPESDT